MSLKKYSFVKERYKILKVIEYEKPRQKRGLKPITFGKVKSYWRKNNRKNSESQREIRPTGQSDFCSPIRFKPSIKHKKSPSEPSSIKKDEMERASNWPAF